MKIIDKLIENFFDTGKIIGEGYGSNPYIRDAIKKEKEAKEKVEDFLKELESLSIDNMGIIMNKWDNLPDIDKKSIGDDMFGDMPLVEFIEEELPKMKKQITDAIKMSKQTYPSSRDRLQKITDVLDRYGDLLDLSDLEKKKRELESEIKDREEKREIEKKGQEAIEKGELTYTQPAQEEKIKSEIKKSNESDLPILSIDSHISSDSDETNLTTLQYILLNNFSIDNDSKEELKKEIKERKFGTTTKTYVELFQNHNGLHEDGIVNIETWNKLMYILNNREKQYLEHKKKNLLVDEDIITTVVKFKEGELNSKEKLFVNTSTKLLNNLIDNEVYSKIEHKRGEEEFKKELEKFVNDYSKTNGQYNIAWGILEKISDKEKLKTHYQTNDRVIKRIEREILDLEYELGIVEERAEDFRSLYGGLFSGNKNERLSSEEKYFNDRRESDKYTIKGFFETIYGEFKKGIEENQYSIDDINNIMFRINDFIYTVFEKDIKNQTKKDKTKRVLKDLINKVSNAEDSIELFSFLEDIANPKVVEHYKYERSFCDCEGGYFECSSLGDQSKIIDKANMVLIGKLKTIKDNETIAEQLWQLIKSGKETKIDKYDIKAKKDIKLSENITITEGSKIEVKKTTVEVNDDYHLAEFFGVYKSKVNIKQYQHLLKNYNEVIKLLVEKLNVEDGGIINSIESEMGGIFLDNYMFYPKGSYKLKWSPKGVGRKGDYRLTLRFEIKRKGYQWVEGNCNLETGRKDESTENEDYISEYVNNLLDL